MKTIPLEVLQTTPRSEAVERFFLRIRPYLVWVHIAMFALFVAVMVVPLLLPDPPGDATPFNNITLFSSYLLWGIWFPLVFLSVIFTGRSWCGILCPMGAASEWTNKIGLQGRIPAWIRWEGTPALSFIIVTIFGQTLGVRDHPEAAAGLFGSIMLLALIVGFVYGRKKRVWCRHLCPIGRVLGLYSRLGPVQFAPQIKVAGKDKYTEKGACPTMINLAQKSESRHCIECFRCVNPDAKGSVRMVFRSLGDEVERIREHRANPAEAWMLFLDAGVALGGFLWLVLPQYQRWRMMLGDYAVEHDWMWLLDVGPAWLMSVHPERAEVFTWLDFVMIVGFMSGFMLAITAILGVLTALSSWLAGRMGGTGDFRQRFVELGYQYAPVAMGSIIIGLGAVLFEPMKDTFIGVKGIHFIKAVLFVTGALWSLWLGERLLKQQRIPLARRWLPLIPGALGSAIIGLCWWPAIFGL